MAVIATPTNEPAAPCCDPPEVVVPTPAAVPCDEQAILSAPVSTVNRQPILTRMRAVSLTAGQCGSIDWTLHDGNGNPVDLSSCGFGEVSVSLSSGSSMSSMGNTGPYKIVFRMRENLAVGKTPPSLTEDIEATVIDAAGGQVRVALDIDKVRHPGVYFGEIALVRTDQDTDPPCMLFSNIFWVIVNRGLYSGCKHEGPPSIAEVRLHLRDSAGAENFLIGRLKFDDAEIAMAISRPVMYWNEVPPPIQRYNTRNFPFRYHWLEGIAGTLFLIAAESFRANNLKYQAAGVAVDDQDKEEVYEAAAARRMQTFREWVRSKKASMNLAEGYAELGSAYGSTGVF